MELRLYQMENKHLTKLGLCQQIVVDNTKQGKKRSGIKFIRNNEPVEAQLKPLAKLIKNHDKLKEDGARDEKIFHEWYEDVPEEFQQGTPEHTIEFIIKMVEGLRKKLKTIRDQIKLALNELKTSSRTFKRFNESYKDLHKVEKKILDDATEIFGETKLWEWCIRTDGLGPVAALTFYSNIDVFTSPTVGNCLSNFGLIPGKTLVSGESSNFNPHVRGRILGIICTNIIRTGDDYYSGIYHIKKEYHKNRPDLVAKKEHEAKSWNMHMHRMTYRVLAKLLVSHAYQLIKMDLGLGTMDVLHRNKIPIKPVDKITQDRVLADYQTNHNLMLGKLKALWKVMTELDDELKEAKGETDQPKTTQEILEIEEAHKVAYKKASDAYYDELIHPTIKFVS